MPSRMNWIAAALLSALLCGCSSPATKVMKMGVKLAGKVIEDDETAKLGQQLIGQPPSAADATLGAPKDVWRDVRGSREWRAYPVKLDVLDQKRYVVGVERNLISTVELIQRHGSKADIPLELVYFAKVKGKLPEACEAALGFGRPLLSARSTMTGQLLQMYDARLVKELTTPNNAILRFDEQDRCNKLNLVEIEASAR